MRAILGILLLAAAVWRVGVDWQATIGVGYAFSPAPIGSVIAHRWPDDYANLVASRQASGVPFAWNPVGALVMSLPLRSSSPPLAGGVWLTRDRPARAASAAQAGMSSARSAADGRRPVPSPRCRRR